MSPDEEGSFIAMTGSAASIDAAVEPALVTQLLSLIVCTPKST